MKLEAIVLTMMLLCVIIYIQIRLRKRPVGDKDGYGLLSYFSDTILFRYDCKAKTLTFTPNLTSRFTGSNTRTFGFSDRDQPLVMIHPDDIQPLQRKLCQRDENCEDRCDSLHIRFLDKDGEYRWMFCQLKRIKDKRERCVAVIGKLSDVQDQRCKEARLIEKASLDAMTGTLNREAAERQITARLGRTKSGFLFMIDIDNFKNINDSQGHSAGDDALVRFAAAIKKTFRKSDTIGRAGGDEFVVFMADIDKASAACQKASQLLTLLSGWEEFQLSASIGIAFYPADGDTYSALYEVADAAMYRVKQHGKNGYYLWESEQD